MPNRILRDGILSSESVCSLTWPAEVFYRRLHSVADDHGRFYASPKLLRSACYPLQIDKVSDANIGNWLTECVTSGLVTVYGAADGKRYIQILKFGQQVRSKSKFPEPVDDGCNSLLAIDSDRNHQRSSAHLDVFEGVVEGEDGGVDEKRARPRTSSPKPAELTADQLVADGLTEQTAVEYLAHRKHKRAKLTDRAWSDIKAEAAKAGWDIESAVRKCLSRGWTGFEASWVAEDRKPGHGQPLAKGAALEAHNNAVAQRYLDQFETPHQQEIDA